VLVSSLVGRLTEGGKRRSIEELQYFESKRPRLAIDLDAVFEEEDFTVVGDTDDDNDRGDWDINDESDISSTTSVYDNENDHESLGKVL